MTGFNFNTDISNVEDAAQKIDHLYKDVFTGKTDAFAANADMATIFEAYTVASIVILSGDQQTLQSIQENNDKTFQLIKDVKQDTEVFIQTITPRVFNETGVDTFIEQLSSINKRILQADPSLFTEQDNLFADFKRYFALIGPLKQTLGYIDYSYSADFEREKFWPNAQSSQGQYSYLNLFRTSESEKAKNKEFATHFATFPSREQMAAFAWIYTANFEEYLSVGPIPDELPPWIDSAPLRELHQLVNAAYMAEYAAEEAEMLQ